MAVVKRGEIPAPVLPKETVEVEALGGEVVVRGLLLTERLSLEARLAQLRRDAIANGDTTLTTGDIAVPLLLAKCVLDAESLPLWTEEQWQAFGCKHQHQALVLFNTAWRLSGFRQDDEAKN